MTEQQNALPLAPSQTSGTLFVVGTPLGNLGDISFRAVETLNRVDIILCEDTRTSAKLLNHYGITKPRKALHDHNEALMCDWVIAQLLQGKSLALISDAGMPLISDPGFRLISAIRQQALPLAVVPGATALTTALAISGLVAYPFYFGGFLANKSTARQKQLRALSALQATLVFYDSPQRLLASLGDVQDILGARQVAVARELTKLYEQVISAPISQVIAHFSEHKARGEIVLIIAPALEQENDDDAWQTDLTKALKSNKLSAAVKQIANIYPVPKQTVYNYALKLKNENQTKDDLCSASNSQ